MKRLTAKHDQFITNYIKSGFAGPSYQQVYKNRSANGARVAACRLLQQPLIIAQVEKVRERMAKRSDITIEKILTDYQEAMSIAREQKKANEIVMAATAQAKLVGLIRERVETGNAGEFDALDNMSEIVQKIADEAGPEAAAKFLSIVTAKEVSEGSSDHGLAELEPPTEAKN